MSNIHDPEARGTMIFAWWMACLADAYRSVYYRRKPMLYVRFFFPGLWNHRADAAAHHEMPVEMTMITTSTSIQLAQCPPISLSHTPRNRRRGNS